jgi:hypothetical protein
VQPLIQKQADCISVMTYNEYWQLIDAGYKPEDLIVFNYTAMGNDLLEDGLYAMEDKLADPAFEEKMVKFVRASMKGWKYATENPDEAAGIVMENGGQDENHQKRMMGEVAKLIDNADGKLIEAAYQRTAAEVERAEDFVDRFPGWAALACAGLDARGLALERAVEALNDRMTHDPHLSQSLHELLSSLSAVRATAAILAETPDLEPDWAARFHMNLHQDSERLVAGAEALVGFLDAGQGIEEQGIAAPQEEVEDWLRGRSWALSGMPNWRKAWRTRSRALPPARRAAWRGTMSCGRGRMRPCCPSGVFAPLWREIGPDPLASGGSLWRVTAGQAMRRLAGIAGVQAGLVTLRRLGHADLPQACDRLSLAALRLGLPALAAVRGSRAGRCTLRGPGADGRAERPAAPGVAWAEVTASARVAGPGAARGGDADPAG